jgi:hypothetical protein
MKIGPAVDMANLLRILYKLKTLDFVSVDRAIDEIQVWVFEHELDPLALKQRDPLLPWCDLVDESNLNQVQ